VSIPDLAYAFETRLKELEPELWEAIGEGDVAEIGRRAADWVVAPVRWRIAVGDVLDTSQLAELLNITRQAIASRVASGSLLALPGRGTRYYPAWQLDVANHRVRPLVAELLRTWRRFEPDVEPLTIATWAMTQNELLGDRSPAEVVAAEDEDEAVVHAAAVIADGRTR
jgi:hypothetical protein